MDKQEFSASELDFLRDLRDVFKKHKRALDGCGCCGSPWIVNDGETIFDVYVDADGTVTIKGQKVEL